MSTTTPFPRTRHPSRAETFVRQPEAPAATAPPLHALLRRLASAAGAALDEILTHRPTRRELHPRDVDRHLLRDIGRD